jgi:hypothetical protein
MSKLALTILLGGIQLVAAAGLPRPLEAFVGRHCVECHDKDVAKADLNLADLKFTPGDPANSKIWQRVFERVRDGEMPPAKKPQPSKEEATTFLADLSRPLLEADQADIAAHGRVKGRRLTRVEYEHTIHDLLGIDIPLQDQLPEDPASHGFQTVADGQQLSHHQLSRYLDAADRALGEAFSRALKGDATFKREYSPELLSKPGGGNYRQPEFRDGKSISWPITLQFFGRLPATQVPADGWYRVTLKQVHSINPGRDGAVWGTLRSGACQSSAPMLYLIGLVEATPQPRDMVFQAWIQRGHMLELKPNDAELRRPATGATGGNVSFRGRDLAKDGYSGIAHHGIEIERIYPHADRQTVRRHLFGSLTAETSKVNPRASLDQLVAQFASRAFRRPVTDAQVAPYREIGRQSLADGDALPEALMASYRAILCSPRFLSLIEAPGPLDDHAIASRLSYAFWVSMPDDQLTTLASQGRLRQPDVLRKQVDRMLADAKGRRFIESFTDQWLKLNEIDFTSPDPRQFRTFDPVLQESMLQETRAYFADLVRKDLGVSHFVDSDHAFLNGRLARHYRLNVPLKSGGGLQKISLPLGKDKIRGGLVTQGAVLKVTADGSTTSPVVRGVFVNERILGAHVPPPPPSVPAIEPDIRGATSIRDQLDKHRSNPSCVSCHTLIDPPGFALESFDPIGSWRDRYGIGGKGVPVDPSGVTPRGDAFADLIGWKKIYRQRSEELAHGFAGHFLTYATGAALRFSDKAAVEDVVAQSASSDHGVKSILQAAVTSPIFLHK